MEGSAGSHEIITTSCGKHHSHKEFQLHGEEILFHYCNMSQSLTDRKLHTWAFNISKYGWKIIIIYAYFNALRRRFIKTLQFLSKLLYYIWWKIFISSLNQHNNKNQNKSNYSQVIKRNYNTSLMHKLDASPSSKNKKDNVLNGEIKLQITVYELTMHIKWTNHEIFNFIFHQQLLKVCIAHPNSHSVYLYVSWHMN